MTALALIGGTNSTGSVDTDNELEMIDEPATGEIQGHPYRVSDAFDDTFVRGRGWEVVLPEAPLALPQFLVTAAQDQSDSRPVLPQKSGNVEHPLGHGVSDTCWCMHCDGSFTSKQVTANLFHCPTCLASPLDIRTSPWWLEPEQAGR